MMEYIFKSALSLAMLYSLFFVFLSRETFHRFNRVALLFTMMASLVLPFVHLTVSHPTAVQEAVQMPTRYLTELPVVQIHPTIIGEGTGEGLSLTWGQLLTYIYLAGVGAMLLFLLVQSFRMYLLIQGGLRHTDNRGNTVILKSSTCSPFSLFRWIVMNVDDYEQHRQSILTHEQEHIRLGHTYDLLLLEAMRIFQWFNPFVWLLGHDLRAIHEYEADEAVINQGIDAKQYQQLLVLKAVGNRLQPFANTLGRGSLKQRIIMMYQKKSNRWKMLKALFVIPTMGFTLYAFATPEVMPEIQKVLGEEVVQPSNTQATTHPKEEVQSLGKDLAYLIENDSNFNVDYSEAKLDKFPVLTLKPEDVLIIDGEEFTLKQLNSLSAEEIDNLTVIKDEKVRMNVLKDILKEHEAKGKAIVIETQKYVKEHGKQSTIGIIQDEEHPTDEVKAGDRISGLVVEAASDGTPLSGVRVSQVMPDGKVVGSTVTDANGHFWMPVNDPQNKLVFAKEGYRDISSGIAQSMYIGLTSAGNQDDTVTAGSLASFPGGDKALSNWIKSNIKYPDSAREKGIQGRVIVEFVIETDGTISNVKVMRSPDEALSSEAIRLVNSMPKWTPATKDGVKVRSIFVLPFIFNLNA